MVNEHVITLTREPTIEDLNYFVRKANKIGLSDRAVFRVFTQEDDEGKHYYFECDALKPKKQSESLCR